MRVRGYGYLSAACSKGQDLVHFAELQRCGMGHLHGENKRRFVGHEVAALNPQTLFFTQTNIHYSAT
jgi:hypothetical protein